LLTADYSGGTSVNSSEANTYTRSEAAFYGNLFVYNAPKAYMCTGEFFRCTYIDCDNHVLTANVDGINFNDTRACSQPYPNAANCGVIRSAGLCHDVCAVTSGASGGTTNEVYHNNCNPPVADGHAGPYTHVVTALIDPQPNGAQCNTFVECS